MDPVPPPVTFQLPAGWTPVTPPVHAGVSFAAVHEDVGGGAVPAITVGMTVLGPGESVDAVADAAVDRLRATRDHVEVRRREPVGRPPSRGVAHEVRFVAHVDGARIPMTQLQVFLVAPDVVDVGTRALYVATFTAAAAQAAAFAPDFRALVAGLRVDLPSTGT